MKPSELKEYLKFAFKNNRPTLITGKPGIGKSDLVDQVTKEIDFDMILDHPVVSDPTDFKGLPFQMNGRADFLPYKNLRRAIEAERPTVYFLDDLGQAPVSVQAAVMQLLLARQVGEHRVSDNVVFVAATNRKEDKAGVTGLLEPVKSRFTGGIIELEVSSDDWVIWALNNGMPIELISYIRFKPNTFDDAKLTKDLKNSASPRTVAGVGKVQNAGLDKRFHLEVFKGIAGEAFASEYCAFLKFFDEMPNIDEIILNPEGVDIPTSPGVKYALTGALSARASSTTIEPIIKYTNRMEGELQAACLKNIAHDASKKEVFRTRAFTDWAIKNKILND